MTAHPLPSFRCPAPGGYYAVVAADQASGEALAKLLPRQSRLCRRPRLEEPLRHAIGRMRLVFLSAPPGAGKTTLLADALPEQISEHKLQDCPESGSTLRSAWLTPATGVNGPWRFLNALIDACARLATGCDVVARELLQQSMQLTGREWARRAVVIVAALLDDLSNRISGPTALVLDNMPDLEDVAVLAALGALVDYAPPELTVVIATRHDLPLPLARLRARRELLELRLPDLRFTPTEARDLFAGYPDLILAEEEFAALYARTEGWPAALAIAATTIGPPEPGRATRIAHLAAVGSPLFNYLAGQLLAHESPFVKMFLLETALLADLDPAHCAALTGCPDAATILDELYRRNLLLLRVGEGEARAAASQPVPYRYHSLFRDILRNYLAHEAPDWARRLHLRAALNEPHPAQAIEHLLAAEAWHMAAALLASRGETLLERGETRRLEGWLELLPPALLVAFPQLLLIRGRICYHHGDMEGARSRATRALEIFHSRRDQAGQAEAAAWLALASYAAGTPPAAIELIAEALEQSLPAPLRTRLLVARAACLACTEAWQKALPLLEEALTLAARDRHALVSLAEELRSRPGAVFPWEQKHLAALLPDTELLLEQLLHAQGCDGTAPDMPQERRQSPTVYTAIPIPGTIEWLTPREGEVLHALATGASNRAIAARLAISLFTVKRHVTSILQKLGAASRTEAILFARSHRLL